LRVVRDDAPMRRSAAVLLCTLLAACASPSGFAAPTCDSSWRDVDSVIETESAAPDARLSVEATCMRRVDDRRVRIGFSMPPGPTCFRLVEVEVEESAAAASITLWAAPHDDPLAGACSEDPARTATEVDLQAPIGDRTLLDGSRSAPAESGAPATMSP
jgi:hypothetical protein